MRQFSASILCLLLVFTAGCSSNQPMVDPTVKNGDQPDASGEEIREESIATLEAARFTVAQSLPTTNHRAALPGKLRPTRDIALRLMALNALFTRTSAPEEAIPTKMVEDYAARNDLTRHLTAEELQIWNLPRASAFKQHAESIGWKLENMWSLAWAHGFETPPSAISGQLPNEVTQGIVFKFLPGMESSIDDLLDKAKPRSEQEVLKMEDLFYCAHNAVRSAQNGSPECVPTGFDPVAAGGAIHERRHALTWALSPKVDWDDTDLST